MNNESTRYSVVRYPDGYTVIDKQNQNKIVFSTSVRASAHTKANRLNRK